MANKLVWVRIVEGEKGRLLVRVYEDGNEERIPILKVPAKKGRLSNKIAWYRDLRTGRKKFY
jgi:hypothetical protein